MDLTFFAILIMSVWVVAIVAAGLVLALRPGGVGVRLQAAAGPPSANGPRDEIRLGGPAEVLGNVRGDVRAVLVDPQMRKMVALRLATGIEDEDIPASDILAADGQTVQLADSQPENPLHFTESSAAVLRQGATVGDSAGKRIGRLRFVSYDPNSSAVAALVIDGRDSGMRLVPFDRVTEAAPDRITTSVQPAERGSLVQFATDWEIEQGILGTLSNDPRLQRSLQVDVMDQRVRVRGYVSDRAQAQQVERAIRGVAGVQQLDLQLVTDDDLAASVMDAIEREAPAIGPTIGVTARTGIVEIAGQVPDRSTARRLEAVARQVPGVQGVRNAVAIRPATAAAS
ncbi:MAG TPA: BON domain-containing protein [Candidatus Dormibacteraeota bacterium]|nr:BON domain-containing protein [Candidatus Dormibacteraeota bacterium]